MQESSHAFQISDKHLLLQAGVAISLGIMPVYLLLLPLILLLLLL